MLNTVDFVKCLKGNLTNMGFGRKRIKELVDEFEMIATRYEAEGSTYSDARLLASDELFSRMSYIAVEKSKRTAKMLELQARNMVLFDETVERVADKSLVTGKPFGDGAQGGVGVALARAAVSMIENDARFGNISYDTRRLNFRNAYWSMFDNNVMKITKGFGGRQKGKAHLPNIAREIFGVDTGDSAAAAIAKSWLKVSDYTVDSFNNAGGSMRRLERYLPQRQSMAKIHKAGKDDYVSTHMEAVDWNKTKWPDGNAVTPSQREEFLAEVYNTKVTDGAMKLDDTKFRGQGGAVGNALEQNRLIHYKDADAWLAVHEKYGDGNVFEALTGHLDTMAHQVATVQTFGPNPEMTAMNVRAMVKQRAAAAGGPVELTRAERVLKNKFDPIFDTAMRKNPMDPNSRLGAGVSAVNQLLTSAQLGSASLLAVGGDLNTTFAVRKLNNMNPFAGLDVYMKGLLLDPAKDVVAAAGKPFGVLQGAEAQRDIAREFGFMMDEVVALNSAQERFTGLTTNAPHIAGRISDAVLRLSGLSKHTGMLRWAAQKEFTVLMRRSSSLDFNDLPYKKVMDRYGITESDWNAFRTNVKPYVKKGHTGSKGALRPIDILDTDLANKQELFDKFQGMILEESRSMTPDATLEASAEFKGTERADTLRGVLLQSFAMYKNFPLTFHMKYSRLAMTSDNAKGRTAFVAGLVAGATFMGALGLQMREISKGRDPLDMTTPEFMGKAALAGGGLSVYGDFLFAGINEYGRGPAEVFSGPTIGWLGDSSQLIFGDPLKYVGGLDEGEDFESDLPARAVQYARRYTPGTSLWWARLQLDRQIWDRLEELADPEVYAKRRARENKRLDKYGNESWFPAGERSPERAPGLGE